MIQIRQIGEIDEIGHDIDQMDRKQDQVDRDLDQIDLADGSNGS